MADLTTLDVVKGVLRFFRRQPLLQVAIAATLWVPLTLLLRLIASMFDAEVLIGDAVAPWAFQAGSAGLAYLAASTFVTLSNRAKSIGRRKERARLREEAKSRKQAEREARFNQVRDAINALEDGDRELLRFFVDYKTTSLPMRALKKNADAIATFEGLNWVWQGSGMDADLYLKEYIYNLLLEHPSLVGSEKKSVLVHDKLFGVIRAFERGG